MTTHASLLLLASSVFLAPAGTTGSGTPPAAPAPAPAPKTLPHTPAPLSGELTEWRYRDGIEPSATAAEFDDSKWEVIHDSATPRGKGGASAGWYRTVWTVPEKLDNQPVTGKSLRLTVLANDYAEVWVNGQFDFHFDPAQPPSAARNRNLGYEIAGFNKANVIDLGTRKPGDKITIAILVVNGPIARPLGKYFLYRARVTFAERSAPPAAPPRRAPSKR